MNTSLAFFVLAAVLTAFAIFVAFTTGRAEAILHGMLGAAISIGLGMFFRTNKLAPIFVKRGRGDKP